ncbi:FAD-dependent monooxygenase [Geodermatophilus sp. SYSU D00710]
MQQRIGERAVVLGGGMAGLLAARVLADAYDRVTVVDRDALDEGPAPRRGVPQGRHVHVLGAGGLQVLEDCFPGLSAELAARGVPLLDAQRDVRWFVDGHRLAGGGRGRTVTVSASRPLLEAVVRGRVRTLPTVEVRDRTDVVGLVAAADGRRIAGVRLLRAADGSAEEHLAADLVVDATGRGSRSATWLADLGYQRPPEERVPIDLCYATRSYRPRPEALHGALGILVAPFPHQHRGAALAMVEDGRCLVTLAGVLGERPPTDPAAWTGWAGSLWSGAVAAALRDAEPDGAAVAFRFPASVRRRYEWLSGLPDGLLVIGDALCSLNPFYGQGMTVAALEAQALAALLRAGRTPSPRRYFRAVARVVDPAWQMTAGGGLAFPGVPGRRTARQRLLGAYVARLHRAAVDDPELTRSFVRVAGLLDPPAALLRPSVLRSVLAAGRRRAPDAPARAGVALGTVLFLGAALTVPVVIIVGVTAVALVIRRSRQRTPASAVPHRPESWSPSPPPHRTPGVKATGTGTAGSTHPTRYLREHLSRHRGGRAPVRSARIRVTRCGTDRGGGPAPRAARHRRRISMTVP